MPEELPPHYNRAEPDTAPGFFFYPFYFPYAMTAFWYYHQPNVESVAGGVSVDAPLVVGGADVSPAVGGVDVSPVVGGVDVSPVVGGVDVSPVVGGTGASLGASLGAAVVAGSW